MIYASVHQIQISSLALNCRGRRGEGPVPHPCTSASLWSLPASTQMGRLLLDINSTAQSSRDLGFVSNIYQLIFRCVQGKVKLSLFYGLFSVWVADKYFKNSTCTHRVIWHSLITYLGISLFCSWMHCWSRSINFCGKAEKSTKRPCWDFKLYKQIREKKN